MKTGVKVDRKFFTAKFKRDYVAFSAVLLFVLIVAGEIALAVSIPLYFVRSDMWNLQIARQKTLEKFDSARRICVRSKAESSDASEETGILLWTLNQSTAFLRTNINRLSMEKLNEINKDLDDILSMAGRLDSDKSFNRSAVFSRSASVKTMTEMLQGEK